MSKFLRIEKSLTSAENVVLAIVNRHPGATLLNCDEETRIEIPAGDLAHLALDTHLYQNAARTLTIQGL